MRLKIPRGPILGQTIKMSNNGNLRDRVYFVTTNFKNHCPDVNIKCAPRVGSDHVSIIVDLGINPIRRPYIFHFEKWWLEREEFQNLVAKTWNTHFHYAIPLDRWQAKVGLLRRKIKG